MRNFLRSPLGPRSLPALFRCNLAGCVLIFALLEIWRPCYFLTDDNLSSLFPLFTEMGRNLRHGRSPFVSHYLFGGHYDMSRDIGALFWHPFYLLPTLLADTWARFWIIDLVALCFFLLAAAGFTLLAHAVVREFNPELKAGYVVFYTMSFLFSSYILWIGPSWINFLGNQSALPWLALGIFQRRIIPGVLLVAVFTLHEIVGAYSALTLSTGLCLTLFAAGIAFCRRSPTPFAAWILGNITALLLAAPFLLRILYGFGHSARAGGISIAMASDFSVSAPLVVFSLFLGNWSEILSRSPLPVPGAADFPYLPFLLACAAAWCVIPALASSRRWRGVEIITLSLLALLVVLIVRCEAVAQIMHRTLFLKSMRWPFREILQFQFFLHFFLLIRPLGPVIRLLRPAAIFGTLLFLLPLPFSRVPSLNPFFLDREELFSGQGELFWSRVRPLLRPGDQVATVIDWGLWTKNAPKIPLTLLDTANYPAYYRVSCLSGYAPTVPLDQVPLRDVEPFFWFGAYWPAQLPDLHSVGPRLRIIRVESANPLRIELLTPGAPDIDLTPYIPK